MAVTTLKKQLSSFEIPHIEGLNDLNKKSGGEGSYGTVYEVVVEGVPRIAKQLHKALVAPDVRPDEKRGIYARFYEECLLLSGLDHPNIVKFIGIHSSLSKGLDIVLVMEKLNTDLDKYLRQTPNIPTSQKLSILLDVTSGLVYLHSRQPPIIHRDLTCGNILLTEMLEAKIADFGVSRVLNIHPNSLATQTRCPGTLAYMPPEAKREDPMYGKALDIFSFGEICLCIIHQQFAEFFDASHLSDFQAAHQRGEIEILKRKKWFDRMPANHCLRDVATSCLQDKPERRPTTERLKEMITELCVRDWKKVSRDCNQNQQWQQQIDILKGNIAQTEAKLQDKVKHVAILEEQLQKVTRDQKSKEKQLEILAHEKAMIKNELTCVQCHSTVLTDDPAGKVQELSTARQQRERLATELQEAHERLETSLADTEYLHDEVMAKTAQVKQYKKQTDSYKAKLEEATAKLQTTQLELQQWKDLVKTMEEENQYQVDPRTPKEQRKVDPGLQQSLSPNRKMCWDHRNDSEHLLPHQPRCHSSPNLSKALMEPQNPITPGDGRNLPRVQEDRDQPGWEGQHQMLPTLQPELCHKNNIMIMDTGPPIRASNPSAHEYVNVPNNALEAGQVPKNPQHQGRQHQQGQQNQQFPQQHSANYSLNQQRGNNQGSWQQGQQAAYHQAPLQRVIPTQSQGYTHSGPDYNQIQSNPPNSPGYQHDYPPDSHIQANPSPYHQFGVDQSQESTPGVQHQAMLSQQALVRQQPPQHGYVRPQHVPQQGLVPHQQALAHPQQGLAYQQPMLVSAAHLSQGVPSSSPPTGRGQQNLQSTPTPLPRRNSRQNSSQTRRPKMNSDVPVNSILEELLSL